jgi:propanediol dehydratase small subunit
LFSVDEKVFVGWPRGRRPTREEALAMARRLVEQMQAQRLLREAAQLDPWPEPEERP